MQWKKVSKFSFIRTTESVPLTELGLMKLVPYVYMVGDDGDDDDVNVFVVAFFRLCT